MIRGRPSSALGCFFRDYPSADLTQKTPDTSRSPSPHHPFTPPQALPGSLERACSRQVADVAEDLRDTLARMLAALAARGGSPEDPAVAAEALCTITLNAVARSFLKTLPQGGRFLI